MSTGNLILEQLREHVIQGKWNAARILADRLFQNGENSELFWILNAAVCEMEGRKQEVFFCISKGLLCNSDNYELYFMLGNYYRTINSNKSYLCYENALFYCHDEEDAKLIRENMQDVAAAEDFCVRPVSIVILSYNIKDILVGCIESIRKNNPKEVYELVVVDNASEDGAAEWLRRQTDIRLQCNSENTSFAMGCNQGINLANEQNDILLLNNDTIVPPHALFWLRMGLYERASIGAVGPLSNYAANGQAIIKDFSSKEEWLEFARQIHIPMLYPYENKLWLIGFAMLISRLALNKVGMLDCRYEWGNFEDLDYGMKLGAGGYEQLLCYNSFIYHYGSLNMAKDIEKYNRYIDINGRKLKDKWGFWVKYFDLPREEYLEVLKDAGDREVNILEIGCGCGATLSRIRSNLPNAKVLGIERNELFAKAGCGMGDMIIGDVKQGLNLQKRHSFDYILVGDELEYIEDPKELLSDLRSFLKPKGRLLVKILSIKNYDGELIGPTGRSLKKIFEGDEIIDWFRQTGYQIKQMKEEMEPPVIWYFIEANVATGNGEQQNDKI